MTKTITLRLSEEEYEIIAHSAELEHRPISNFMTHATLSKIKESRFVDHIEMTQIKSDEKLMSSLKKGHEDAGKKRGKFAA